jgi:hypothetical protein
MKDLAVQTLPLAIETKSDEDYPSVINLLCHIAERGDSRLRRQLGNSLFPKGTRVPVLLAQVAPLFEKNITDVDLLIQTAKKITGNLRLQVQRVPIDQEPNSVNGTLLMISRELDNGQKLIVSITDTIGLAAMAVHRQRIPADTIKLLVDSIIEMIEEPENSLSNKAALINHIADFGDSLTNSDLNRMLKVLRPLAWGKIIEPSYSNSTADQNPLSRYQRRDTTPIELRAVAIYILARLNKSSKGDYGTRLHDIIEAGLRNSNSQIRRAAFAAAREIPHIPKSIFTALLLGTRDTDPSAATVAYNALATKRNLRLTSSEWQLFAYSLNIAQQSPEVRVRRAAASAVSNFIIGQKQAGEIISTLRRLQREFADDISWSVREAAKNRK